MKRYCIRKLPSAVVISFVVLTVTLANGIAPRHKPYDMPFNMNEVIEPERKRNAPVDSRNSAFLLDTIINYIPAGDHQYEPAIAFDGTNYLVVWRNMTGGSAPDKILGTRVNTSGVIIDSAGISISTRFSSKFFPSTAFNGTNYLVVWDDYQNQDDNIYGARVSPAGVLLDPDGIAISIPPGWQNDPAATSDGTNYFVVWTDGRPGVNDDLYGARISPDGTVLDPDGIVIAAAPGFQGGCNALFDGTNYFIVWCDTRNYSTTQFDIYGARVSPSGIVLDPDGIAISTEASDQSDPAVAFDGTNYLVAWIDMRGGLYDIYCARVNPSGVLIDTVSIFVDSTEFNWQTYISDTFDGVNFLVAWQDSFIGGGGWLEGMDVHGARITPSGVLLDTIPIHISTERSWQYKTALASDGTNSLVVWCDYRRFLSADIYGTRIDQAGTVLEPEGIVISSSANTQDCSSVAFDGTNYLVAWQDERNGEDFDIYCARVDESGSILDPTCIEVSSVKYHQTEPSIAFDGTNYFVVWQDARDYPDHLGDIYGSRINQSGVALDTAGILIAPASDTKLSSPVIAFGNTNYLVAWEDDFAGDVYYARVSQSGIVLDTGGIVISGTSSLLKPSVAFDGTNYFAVWRIGDTLSADIYGSRINQAGHIIDTNHIAISTASGCQDAPSVAFDGVNYLVVWGGEVSQGDGDVCCARVSTAGVVLDPTGIPISTAPSNQCAPFVVFDGTDYLIVWQDNRNSLFSDLYGAKVNTSGMVIDSFIIALQDGHQSRPAIAHGTNDQLLITYAGWTDSINARPASAMRIWGRFYPFIGIEEEKEFLLTHKNINLQIYPVPFSDKVNIEFGLPNGAKTGELKVFDVTGRLVKSFRVMRDARHTARIIWDGTDHTNRQLPSGVYFLKLEARDYTVMKKVIMIL